MKCIKVVFFNTVFVGPVFLLVTFPYAYWSGLNCGYQLPTFPQVICQLLVFVLSVEAGFYYTHRYIQYWTIIFILLFLSCIFPSLPLFPPLPLQIISSSCSLFTYPQDPSRVESSHQCSCIVLSSHWILLLQCLFCNAGSSYPWELFQ